MKIYAAAFLFLLSVAPVCWGSQYAVSMDSGVFPPGGTVDFVLYSISQDQAVFSLFPDKIICTLKANRETMQIVAKRLGPKHSAAAGDIPSKAAYFFELPAIIGGEVVITLRGIDVPAQYVDMIGESLIDYEDRNRAFRLGLAITR